MNMMYKRLLVILTLIMIIAFVITGCTSQASNIGLAKEDDSQRIGTDFVVAEVGSYDSADTAVVLSVDPDLGYVTFMNIMTGKQYTLSYDGTTYVMGKYEEAMAMSQINAGDIVDITFLKGKKRLASVQLSPQAWAFDNVENYDLGGMNKTATIGSNTYSLPDQVVVMSDGSRAEVMNVVDKDVLSIRGIDHTIYSISVSKGHGYLRLSNDQPLIGGWIEVGNTVIQKITENMLLVVPEGSYQVVLTNGNASCVKDVVIERNKEVILDASDLEIIQDKTGKLLISVEPSDAAVSIDGETVDISEEIELTYGIHQIRLEAEGYQTMTKYIQVGSEYASLNFVMEEGEDTEENANSVSDNNSVDEIENAATGNKVYVEAPYNVEVYVDNNYVGISPVSFVKRTGSHTITLRKAGYESKSYTVYLYDDGQDITYSFTDLEPEYVAEGKLNTSGSSTKTTSSTSTTSTGTTNNDANRVNVVTVVAPNGASVYLDDNIYVGIVGNNANFTKIIGEHKITLTQEGYESATYRIFLYNDGRDIEYTFADLKPLEANEPEDPNDPDKPDNPDDPSDPGNRDDNNGDDGNGGDDNQNGDGDDNQGGDGDNNQGGDGDDNQGGNGDNQGGNEGDNQSGNGDNQGGSEGDNQGSNDDNQGGNEGDNQGGNEGDNQGGNEGDNQGGNEGDNQGGNEDNSQDVTGDSNNSTVNTNPLTITNGIGNSNSLNSGSGLKIKNLRNIYRLTKL